MNAINIEHISKIYKLYNKPSDRLKESFNIFNKQYHKNFYALNDVTFNIEKGETVGIIGANGAGKSTLLKIITGVLTPSSGEIEISGRVSALLELGAGFNMDYTGIENIYMNGTILGYTKKEMEEKLEAILEFADIGDFVYQPVKTYSSGMLVRLAFSLSINVEPEILIIDEALAVGDAFFQAKCFNKLEEIKKAGTTILFVSHDTMSVKKLCNRAVWLENGTVKEVGNASDICEKYLSMQISEQNRQNEKLSQIVDIKNYTEKIEKENSKSVFKRINYNNDLQVSGVGNAEILAIYIKDEQGSDSSVLETGKEYCFGMLVKFTQNFKNVLFGFEIESTKGVRVIALNNYMTNDVLKSVTENEIYEVNFKFELPKICSGEYLISVSVASGSQKTHIVLQRLHNIMLFNIYSSGFNLALIELEGETSITKYKEKELVLVD